MFLHRGNLQRIYKNIVKWRKWKSTLQADVTHGYSSVGNKGQCDWLTIMAPREGSNPSLTTLKKSLEV